jgi:uncharacterized protein (TIGR00304 family)
MDYFLIVGFLLVLLGFFLIFLSLAGEGKKEGEAGGVILIGPIPIVFGTSGKIVIISLIIVIIILAILLIFKIK